MSTSDGMALTSLSGAIAYTYPFFGWVLYCNAMLKDDFCYHSFHHPSS